MAWRLNDYVDGGFIFNTRRYSTHGWIYLRGCERPLAFELTGDCEPDLRGRHIRFTADASDPDAKPFDEDDEPRLHWHQVGPTGVLTANEWARSFACSRSEFVRRVSLGEAPPTVWKRKLSLEWFSQNGRVVIELLDPLIELCVREGEGEEDEGDWVPLPITSDPPFEDPDDPPQRDAPPEISVVENPGGRRREPRDEEDEAFQSIPSELQRDLDRRAMETDRLIGLGSAQEDDAGDLEELELMDTLMAQGQGELIFTFLEKPELLPQADDLTEFQAEVLLKRLLSELAMCGIALDVCEHFTPRDSYRLLMERILREERAFHELKGTGWVQHFCTWEYCPKCEEETDRRFEEERASREGGDSDHDDD